MPQSKKEPVNKEAFKMLAFELGLHEACRRLDIPIATGKTWKRRGKWKLPKVKAGRPPKALVNPESSLTPIADIQVDNFKTLENRTKSSLATATSKAGDWLSQQEGNVITSASARLRDLAAAASRVFGWDANKGGSAVTLNQIVVSPEQLEQIRALRAS